MNSYKRTLKYVRPYWKHLTLSVIFTFLYSILNGASVYLSIPLLDTLFQQTGVETVQKSTNIVSSANWIDSITRSISIWFKHLIFTGSVTEILMRICILILIAFLGKNIFGYLQSYFLSYVEQGVVKDLRNDAYQHLHKLPMSFFKSEKTGNLISRITNDVNMVQTSISAVFLNLLREPLNIIVFLGIAISISWKLTLFSIFVFPFSIGIISWIGIKLRKQSGLLQKKMADITTVLHETITGVKIVKAFGMESYENSKFREQTEKFFRLTLKIVRIRNTAAPLTEFLSVLAGIAIIYFGSRLVLIDKSLSAGEFLGFLFAIFQMMPPIKELSSVNNRIQESSAAADRIFEILDTEPMVKNIENPVIIKNFNEEIKFNNVSFHYDDSDELVLDKVNFKVRKGEIIALVGSSGAGKTTLVDLIPRFYDPTEGNITIDNIDIRKIEIDSLRALMGIVTQETILFNESVRDNIAYGYKDYPLEKIIEAAKAANAHNFIMELPNKYDTIIGEKGTKLSGGQRQRISIARALLKNPPIMILDEATSSLDNESEVLVQEAIERLMKERTTFVIAHRLSTIRNADRILVLDKGKIVQDGKHEDLLKDQFGIYKRLYELQFRD
ncbi:ABC transporter ATP-binding protein [Melioribacteraceae bacterium 4301-Me]|uniref:ABC transporter ATP-binding protein n=1 Tax=Pyranulibacter aquaticus TaxID=3163344 RepID=UPI00359ABD86